MLPPVPLGTGGSFFDAEKQTHQYRKKDHMRERRIKNKIGACKKESYNKEKKVCTNQENE